MCADTRVYMVYASPSNIVQDTITIGRASSDGAVYHEILLWTWSHMECEHKCVQI